MSQPMKPPPTSATLLGRTIRWTFSDGPVKGQTFDHTFNDDGSVTWRSVGGDAKTTLNREKHSGVVPVSGRSCWCPTSRATGSR